MPRLEVGIRKIDAASINANVRESAVLSQMIAPVVNDENTSRVIKILRLLSRNRCVVLDTLEIRKRVVGGL